ncbi:bacterial cell division membrane protein [Actinobacteria bacterium IMCC26207]|nr:bacterial cell division membrane protein [Actinobacteria bacterium IMCC26207]
MQSIGVDRRSISGFRGRDVSSAWKHVDIVLLVATALVLLFGLVMVYSATRRFPGGTGILLRQGLFVVVGIAAMFGVSLIDYRRIADWWQIIYGVAMLVLAGVLSPLGSLGAFGTRGWYAFGPLVFQPVEIAKLATVLAVASYLGSVDRVDLRRLGTALVLLVVPMGLTMLQPDLGSALVFIVVGLGMLVVGGVRMRHLTILVILGVVAVFGILQSSALDQYQKDRLTAFANPDGVSAKARYNIDQAQTAISSGGLTGYGLGKGPSTRLGYVPAQQTDFIFTVAGEEFGFVGSGLLLILFAIMIWRIWRAAQLAADSMGTLLCIGVMSMFLFHIFENVGMNLGIMPVTGIPLPLVSQGGSAVVASCIALGLVQSVHMHRYA